MPKQVNKDEMRAQRSVAPEAPDSFVLPPMSFELPGQSDAEWQAALAQMHEKAMRPPMTVAPSGPVPKMPGESAEEAYARLFSMLEAKRQRYMAQQQQREQEQWLAEQQQLEAGGQGTMLAPHDDDIDPNGSFF
jgi:hypothetical protein